MKKPLPRIQTNRLRQLIRKFPVTAVVGARQVGKTTLVKELLGDQRAYFTLDDPAVVLAATENPMAFLGQSSKMIIDEVQKCPSLFPALKRMVDEKRRPGQFIVTGSANLTMLPQIRESLAGRIAFLEVAPLTFQETNLLKIDLPRGIRILSHQSSRACWQFIQNLRPENLQLEKSILKGGYPVPFLEASQTVRTEWFNGYVRTYLERDIRDISRIEKLYDFQKFMALSAFRTGQILNRSDLARDAGVANTTSGHFFNLLLATFQIFLIQPYFRNIGKRLIKSPKLIWTDSGLACHLQGISSWNDLVRLGRSGFMVESKIISELKTLLAIYQPLAKLYYWRTTGGAEVDLVVEMNGRLIPIEVKWTEFVNRKDIRGMNEFLKDFSKQASWGIVLYRGKETLKLTEKIFVLPVTCFL